MAGVIDNPNTMDPSENHFRLRLLFYVRAELMGEVPPDTQWYEVRNLGDDELKELLIIARCGLDNLAENNELIKVLRQTAPSLTSLPAKWRKPILWGHDKCGPFSIIEGNHRLAAYTAHIDYTLSIPVLVGLSPTPCFFHYPDAPHFIANDLWRTANRPPFTY